MRWLREEWVNRLTLSGMTHLSLSKVDNQGDIRLFTDNATQSSTIAEMPCEVTVEGREHSEAGTLSMASDPTARDWTVLFAREDGTVSERKGLQDSEFERQSGGLSDLRTLPSDIVPSTPIGKGKGKAT